MTHSLLFDDSIELCGGDDGSGYWFETLSAGTTFGDPQPVEVAIQSLLRDGALTQTESDGNREQAFSVLIKSTDSLGLADGMAALHRCVQKRTTLVWTPPDGYGPATVFDVQTSSLSSPGDFDDIAFNRNEQTVILRLVCLPYARSIGKVVDNAGTPPSTGGTIFNACESTTGWSTYDYNPTGDVWAPASFSVDAVKFSVGAGSIKSLMTYWYPGRVADDGSLEIASGVSRDQVTGMSLSTGTGGYLTVAIAGETTNTTTLLQMWTQVLGAWVKVTSWTAVKRDPNGFVHYVWPVAGGQTVTGLRFYVQQKKSSYSVPRPSTWYDDFELLPSATTDHQIVKELEVQGSARTTGSLHIAAAADSVALGQVLAITMPSDEVPDGFQPDGRRWMSQGTLNTDSTSPDGSFVTPSTSVYSEDPGKPIFDVPVSMLTAGPYAIVALVKSASGTLTFGVQAQLRIGSTSTGPLSVVEVSQPIVAGSWQFVALGTAYLPPLPMQTPDPTAKVRLLFKGSADLSNLYMIPAWAVGGRSVADFSIVDCGTGVPAAGGPSSNLWIDSPSVDQPQGGWWRGPTSDRVNAQSAWPDAKKPGVHSFRPGSMLAFLVSTAAQGPTMALEYFPSWYGNAAL